MPFVPDKPAQKSRFVPDAGPRAYNPFANDESSLPPLPGEEVVEAFDKGQPRPGYLERVNQAAGRLNRAPDTAGLGTLEAIGTMLTGGIAAPILGTAESIALGTDPEESFARYTYQPRTESGKAQLGLLGAAVSPITESGTDIALAPLFAGESRAFAGPGKIAPNAGRNSPGAPRVPARPGQVADAVAPRAEGAAPAVPQRAAGLEAVSQIDPVKRARDAGFTLKPSEAGAKAGAVVEGLTGSAKLETSLVRKNQKLTNKLVREEFGLPEGPITRAVINQKKAPHNAVYQQVSKLGEVPVGDEFRAEIAAIGRTPGKSFQKDINKSVEELKSAYVDEQKFDAADAVLKVRELRFKAGKNIGSRDPAQQELGYAQRAIAEAIDNQLQRHATALGKTDLVSRYRNARQELAKLHSLEIAARGGEVSAPILAKQLERGVPLSGNLRTIAEVANDFPNVMREGRKVKGGTPVNMAETFVGLGGAAAVHPAMLATIAARPITRALLSSKRYQNTLAKGERKGNTLREQPQTENRNALLEY